MTFEISDLAPTVQNNIILHGGHEVTITQHVTPFGRRRYFLCPYCKRQCAKLHYHRAGWHCQACISYRLYAKRQDLYDRGRDLISWHMSRLLEKNNLRNLHTRPKHMSKRRFNDIVTKYERLRELSRFSIFFRYKPTAKHVKAIMAGSELIDIRQFSPRYKFEGRS